MLQMSLVKSKKKGRKSQPKVRGPRDWTLGETAAGLSSLWSYARAGMSIFNTEVKMFDTQVTGSTNWTGTTQAISLIGQGNDYNQRSGNSIRLVGIEFQCDSTLQTGVGNGRMIIFRDNDARGALATAQDLLEFTGSASSTVSPYTHVNPNRWKILHDHVTMWGEASGGSVVLKSHRGVIPCKDHIEYIGTGTTSASSGEGALAVCWIGNLTTASTYSIQMVVRLFYVDN